MKRIITCVIWVLAVLMFSASGSLAQDFEVEELEIKYRAIKENGEEIEVEIELYTEDGNFVIRDIQGSQEEWPEEMLESYTTQMISIHHKNPCWVCIGSRCWRRNC